MKGVGKFFARSQCGTSFKSLSKEFDFVLRLGRTVLKMGPFSCFVFLLATRQAASHVYTVEARASIRVLPELGYVAIFPSRI